MDQGEHAQADGIAIVEEGKRVMTDMFSVATERAGGVGVVVLTGEVDIYTAPRFKEAMLELLDAGVGKLVVDLSAVTFIDSTALGVLIGGLRRVHDAGGVMALVVATPAVQRVLTITGLDRVFDVRDTRDAALVALA
jgi:anti-sigma B factor antagonist